MNSLSKFPSCCVTSELVAGVPQWHHRAHCFELSLGLKTRENRMIHFMVLFIVTVFINITKTINITPRGHPDAATEISLFSLTKYQIPLMVSVGFGCTRVICCQGKEAKFQFGEFPVLFFFYPEGAVVCLSHPQKQLWEQRLGGEGLLSFMCWELEQEQAHRLA